MKAGSIYEFLAKFWLWPTVLIVGVIVLGVSPGGFAEKTRLLVHGLCAQTPGHTFTIGGQPLPFDGRMTGIYAGVFCTLIYLAVRRKLLARDLPAIGPMIALGILGGAMAADGFNSLLTDLGVWHPWETTNYTRLVTGYGAGVALTVALVWLVSGTLFQLASPERSIATWRDLAGCLLPLALVIGTVLWSPGWLYMPVSAVLVISAWFVVGTLAMVTLLLLARLDDRIMSLPQLHVPAAAGLVLGLGIMFLLAMGRKWLEQTMGIPSNL